MKLYDELVWRGLIKDISSPELAEKYSNLFQFPEIFVREGDEIKAVPVKPSVRDKLKTNTAEIKKETQGKEHNKSEHEI